MIFILLSKFCLPTALMKFSAGNNDSVSRQSDSKKETKHVIATLALQGRRPSGAAVPPDQGVAI
jgi:hypothetical protein